MSTRRALTLLLATFGLAILWSVYGNGDSGRKAGAEPTSGDNQVRAHLEQAASSVIAAAKQSVQAADSDDEAVNRAQLSVEALRVIGMLGEFDTDAQTEKLLNELQSAARPAVAEAIIQLRLANQLQQWDALDSAAREQAIKRFVADVKASGLTRGHADLFLRISDMLERANQSELASAAIRELLPAFQASSDPSVQRRVPLLEGILRRLPGNRLELEGTLLGGGMLDWDSFRGKVVLVDFFASWCGPCRAEVPNVLANYREYRDQGFEVVGVNMDKDRREAETYVKQAGFNFPTLFSDDPNATGWDHPMGRKYGVTALPRVILVDKDGVVVSTEARGPKLRMLLEELLGPPGASNEASSEAAGADGGVVPAGFEEETAPEAVPEGG